MKKTTLYPNNTSKRYLRIGLPLISFFSVILISGCGQSDQYSALKEAKETSIMTYQEIGFFGEIKQEQWSHFLTAVQKNISHSRKEPGNISFSLYQPEDGSLRPIWFERFQSKAAHNYHKQQAYFNNAIAVIQQSLAGKAESVTLELLQEIPLVPSATTKYEKTARQVVTLLEAKPGQSKAVINTLAALIPRYRKTKGNLEYNLYRCTADSNKFVLIEGWQTQSDHLAQLKRYPLQGLEATLKNHLANTLVKNRWMLKDISQP